jgi:hypothetical protein
MTDPKPNLSRAAIEANIEYYQAQGAKHAEQYRWALEQETHWMRELVKLANQERSNRA